MTSSSKVNMASYLAGVTTLVLLVFVLPAENHKHQTGQVHRKNNIELKDTFEVKAKPSATTRGALGQGFDIAKIDLLSKQLQATGAKIFESLPYDECTQTDQIGSTSKDDKSYTDTESIYNSIATSTKVSPSLKGPFTLGASVSAVTNNIESSDEEVSGLSLNIKAISMSEALSQDCINKKPLAEELVKDFEALNTAINKPWLIQSWRMYKVFLEKYGSHIVKETQSGSSIYQYVFSKSSKKFTQRDFEVKACITLAGPTAAGQLGLSPCSEISKKEKDEASKQSMEKKLVVRGGTSDTRADLTGELKPEQINKFLKEGQTDPSPIQYSFYPIWTILKARYIGTDHFAKAINLEQFYKGFLSFGCSYDKTSNGKELQKFELSEDSDPEAPSYVCKIGPEGCRVDDDCHLENALWCECRGESCVKHSTSELESGSKKKEAFATNEKGWKKQGCKRKLFKCLCSEPKTDWIETWSGDQDGALSDVHKMMKWQRDQGNSTAKAEPIRNVLDHLSSLVKNCNDAQNDIKL